jgi:hypothetical protein
LLEQLFSRDYRLPLNRKEAFYSATVLPGIICSDELAGFFKLLGKPDIHIDLSPETTNVQIFSEYDLLDAIRGDQMASDAWRTLRLGMTGDTPDLVILVEQAVPLIVIVEAKLFDKSVASIVEQIDRQRANIQLVQQVMLPKPEMLHVALVPESSATTVRAMDGRQNPFTTITWEDIVTAYGEVPRAAYWVRVLKFALRSEQHLRAVGGSGRTHEDGRMTSAAILNAYDRPDCVIRSIGCLGPNWKLLKEDITGSGGTRKWAVSYKDELPSRHYLSVKDFVECVRGWMRSAVPECSVRVEDADVSPD